MIGRGLLLKRTMRQYADDAKLFRAGVEGYLETCVRLDLLATPRAALRAGRTYLRAERQRERRMAQVDR
ncbi:MAG: hypothetical protein QOF36_2523 [Microbacteriaceae bacterium]|jgi:hypothetical protein|nr:hypothetical protein [Microbacteriaceae bacterium]